ncbi:MAG: hypothetical protein WCM76_05420 [Bacteroidota bacterium]
MKKKSFEIPASELAGFAELLQETGLRNEIAGKGEEDDNIIINIFYQPDERQAVYELMEWVDDNIGTEDDEV